MTISTDADPMVPGNIIDFYSQESIPGTWDPSNIWNREHVWCQSLSWYDGVKPSTRNGGTDLHQLRPTIPNINSSRNNNRYGEFTNRDKYKATFKGNNYYKNVSYDYGYVDAEQDKFEPLDSVKGDVARILMYMLVRYKSNVDNGFPITKIVNVPSNSIQDAYNLLIRWNNLDPVNEFERTRNEETFKIQGNRNPFIDNPSYATLIWGK